MLIIAMITIRIIIIMTFITIIVMVIMLMIMMMVIILICCAGNYFYLFNPFAFIGRYLTSKGKVKVRDIYLNISFLTGFFSFFHSYMKKSSKSSLKKRSDISLQHKNETSYKFSKKSFALGQF